MVIAIRRLSRRSSHPPRLPNNLLFSEHTNFHTQCIIKQIYEEKKRVYYRYNSFITLGERSKHNIEQKTHGEFIKQYLVS